MIYKTMPVREEYLEALGSAAAINKEVGSIINGTDIHLSLFQEIVTINTLRSFVQIPRNKLILLPVILI